MNFCIAIVQGSRRSASSSRPPAARSCSSSPSTISSRCCPYRQKQTSAPALPAPWTLGNLLWRNENKDAAEVADDVAQMRQHGLAVSGLWLDRPYDVAVNESYKIVPNIDQSLAHVYDQDTANLAAQTRGFKGSMKRAQTLGNYQEVRIRHLHNMVARYVNNPL